MTYKNKSIKEYQKEYRQKHNEEIKAQQKEYFQRPEVKAKVKEYKKEWYQNNRTRILKEEKEHDARPENKMRRKEYVKKHYQENKERIIQKSKEYYEKNKEEISKRNKPYRKKYEQKNKQKINQRQKIYRQENNQQIKERSRLPEAKEKRKVYCEINKEEIKQKRKEYSQRLEVVELYRDRHKKQVAEENKRRKKLGLALVGEGFRKEMELLVYVHNLFQDYEILTHHRKPLKSYGTHGLELDIYIPELKLAFEYNGKQHYEWIDFFHTEEEFKAQQYRDRCKKKICKLKGITLIRIKFDEKLSEQLVLTKIKHLPFITSQGNFG